MNIRNIAIIAHVDHGKTTLVDALLRQSKTKIGKETEAAGLIMDSNELERERGITIFSKNASVVWSGVKINIIDTPGHADFGGEVERVLNMADAALLLVDAKEGPMPQTRFVLKKALAMNLKIIVVINKIDKPDARPPFALDKTFDLFVELGAPSELLDFPVIYTVGKQGLAGLEADVSKMQDVTPLFETILTHVPAPTGDVNKPLQILVTTVSGDSFKGRIATGKIYNGILKAGVEVAHINRSGEVKKYRPTSVMTFEGLGRVDAKEILAGDIVAISGIPDINIGETIADANNPVALPLLDIEEPTVKMTFSANDSPFAGREGQFTTSRQIRERLFRELETDMALQVLDEANGVGGWIVSGRGELHLAILIERLRREGYEFQVSRPQVILKEIDGKLMAPYEKVFIEVPEIYSGVVIQKLGGRHGIMQNMKVDGLRQSEGLSGRTDLQSKSVLGTTFLEFFIPTRGLFGYRSEFLTDTKGMGIMNSLFDKFAEDYKDWKDKERGSLVAHETGVTKMYGLLNVQDRGVLFFGPGVEVYKGQVVGENAREEDIRLNVCKEKELSNMRSKNQGLDEHFNTPRTMDLEAALEYIGDDELVEVTPKNVRIRKRVLDENEERRKKALGLAVE
ncbi:MAG: translational GTPase TypA [Candidatus Liptonbacteria bacterium]|nr:translational GTPase TypA [Candidatus Liptonbacteria bacterium]